MKYSLRLCYSVITLAFFLTGCAKTQLHLINQGYTNEQLDKLTATLKSQGVNVTMSQVPIPSEFPDSALALNPSFSNIEFINTIQQSLAAHNFSTATLLRFVQGQHFYNTDHAGLYLRNPNNTEILMPPYLRTQFCQDADATIMFKKNGEFIVEYEGSSDENELNKIKGRYDFDGKNLSVKPENFIAQHFVLFKETRSTPFGDKSADVFKAQNKSHSLQPLKCDFLIIYMN